MSNIRYLGWSNIGLMQYYFRHVESYKHNMFSVYTHPTCFVDTIGQYVVIVYYLHYGRFCNTQLSICYMDSATHHCPYVIWTVEQISFPLTFCRGFRWPSPYLTVSFILFKVCAWYLCYRCDLCRTENGRWSN